MTTNAERKFVNLRQRLDQLGYKQPLVIESLPLVEKLVSDLILTTESLQNAKLASGKPEKDSQNVDASLEPYRTDNSRLVRENNELHLRLMKLSEEEEQKFRELKAHVRKLENEATDLKFLNNQYVHNVRTLEKESKAKTERILQLQEKNLQAVVQTPGGKKRSIPFRRQRMQIDELLPPSSGHTPPSVRPPDDPYIADLLHVADDRIQELQKEVSRLKLDVERAQTGNQQLSAQVDVRDQEIQRLSRALDGGRPHHLLSLEAQNLSNGKRIAQLTRQIGYLQETNQSLEKRIHGLTQQQKTPPPVLGDEGDLSARHQELCLELTHIDQLAQQLEKDKETVLETADMELQEAKREISRLQQELQEREKVISTLRRDVVEADNVKERLRSQILDLEEHNERIEGMEKERNRLLDKVEMMQETEKELVLELERMRSKHGICGTDHSPSRLDAFVKSLEEERNYYKQEVERCHRVRGRSDKSPGTIPGRGRSPKSKSGKNGKTDSNVELVRVAKERDALQAVLMGLEKHMDDIQTRVKHLTAERDQLNTRCRQAGDELRRVQRELESSQLQHRIRDQRQLAESQKIHTERELLKAAQSAAHTDGERDKIHVRELENAIETVEREKADLRCQMGVMKDSRAAVEKELKSQSELLLQNIEEATKQRAENSALRLLQEQMELSISEIQHRLSVKMAELQDAHQQIHKLEEKIAEFSRSGLSQKDEVAALQNAVALLDREKDALQDAVDHKTEALVTLQDELLRKDKTLAEVRQTIAELENSLRQLNGALTGREREIASLRRQLDQSQEELSAIGRDREAALRDNRRMQEDLVTMTRENQAVHREMQEALNEREELKSKVHFYISEVTRIESLIDTKDKENKDMLQHFHSIHTESEDREMKLQQAEGLNNAIRLELMSSDTERRHLRERISLQEREIQEHLTALQAHEAQVAMLTRAITRLEEELQEASAEKSHVQADLTTVRELCLKMDTSKDLSVRQLTAKSAELEKVLAELEMQKKQLASERLTVRNLEALIATNRQKEFQTHRSAGEKEAELKALKERLLVTDSKTAGHAREVSELRGKVSQLQTELDVLRRQLTQERYERQKAVQEMRRQGLSFSSKRSSSPLSPRAFSPERHNHPNPK